VSSIAILWFWFGDDLSIAIFWFSKPFYVVIFLLAVLCCKFGNELIIANFCVHFLVLMLGDTQMDDSNMYVNMYVIFLPFFNKYVNMYVNTYGNMYGNMYVIFLTFFLRIAVYCSVLQYIAV